MSVYLIIQVMEIGSQLNPKYIPKMRRLIALICIGFSLLIPQETRANNTAFRFTNISVEQGIGSPNVLKVIQDSQGFIWVATQDGLSRYDGYDFKLFKHDPDDPNSLADMYINTLYIDNSGVLWIGTDAGIAYYDDSKESFVNFQHEPGNPSSLSNNIVMSIVDGQKGDLWIATLGGGLNRLDRSSNTFTHFQHEQNNPLSLSDDSIYSVILDSRGIIWLGTRNTGLSRFNPETNSFTNYQHEQGNPNSLSHNKVYTLLEDSKQNFWVGTRGGGLNLFNRETETFQNYQHQPNNINSIASDQVFAIFEDSVGVIWVGTDKGGLSRLDKDSNQFVSYRHNPQIKTSVADDDVYSISQDNNGLIWLGTLGGGISMFDPASERFGLIQHDVTDVGSISEGVVWAILQDRKGILWVGTGSGLNRFDATSGQFQHFRHDSKDPHSLSDSDVRSLFEDLNGNIWVGTNTGGLNQIPYHSVHQTTRTLDFIHFQNHLNNESSLSDNHVSVIHQDHLGALWVGTQNGLNRFEPKTNNFTRFTHTDSPGSISQNDINTIYSTRDGSLWVGTLGGLNLFDEQHQTFSTFQNKPENTNSLSHNSVNAMEQDTQGNLWIATSGGVNKFDPVAKKFKQFRLKQGLLSDRVHAILIDSKGNIWIGEDGLSMLDPKTEKIRNKVGEEAGCAGSNQGAYFKAQDGKLFFGSHGLCAFYPTNIITESEPPKIVFTDFRLLNKSVNISSKILTSPLNKVINHTQTLTLKHNDNVLSFEFSGLDYKNPRNIKYRYKLEDFNHDWIETGSYNRRATFTNLSSGEYWFRVTASNSNGVWNEQGRSIKLNILPAPWRTWWAYCFYAGVLIGCLLVFIRSQQKKVADARMRLSQENEIVRRLKRLDKLKDNFLTNTSHELRTPLNGIIGISESLIMGTTGELPQETKNDLQLVVNCGLRLSDLVSDILDFSRLESNDIPLEIKAIDLRKAVDVTLSMSRSLIKNKDLKLINEVAQDFPMIDADDNRLQQILTNLIGNAIKFTEVGFVRINAQEIEGFVYVKVIDSGIGIPADMCTKIFSSFTKVERSDRKIYEGFGLGLSISKRLIELHGGKINAESTPCEGTTMTFTLPICKKIVPIN